tara:strand:- start:482 stop:772 length:291 start_codon:yes stop_codon:yes gene_type:complete
MVIDINDNLKIAAKLLSGRRHKEYGDKKTNHDNIAKLWSAYLGIDVNAHDVAILMLLLKIARTKSGNPTEDTYIDMVGYSAIAGEVCENNKKHRNK